MRKIEFINDSAPYLSAENLNLLQDNVEEGIEESKLEEYSTSEQRIGTWIDGKPLYRKIYTGHVESSGQLLFELETSINVVNVYGLLDVLSDSVKHPIGGYANSNFYSLLQINYDDTYGIKLYFTGYAGGNKYTNYTLTLEYTKTTD